MPLLPAVSDTGPQGFVRVINHSDIPGEVIIDAFDETGRWHGPLVLSVRAGGTTHFNSHDLENGNASKGLLGRAGSGNGNWWLTLSSRLDIEVLSYVRTPDGFLTAMNGVAPSVGERHRVPIFNPGSNVSQRSLLRLVNPGGVTAEVVIGGVDDAGVSPGRLVRVSVPARAARMIPSDALESGGRGLAGSLGDGAGKWQLTVETDQPILVMSLLTSPTGHITNLSAAPHRGATTATIESGFRDPLAGGGEGPPMVVVPAGEFRMGCLVDEQDPLAETDPQDDPIYDCSSGELPVRDVTIGQSFALSAHEITFADWEACVENGGCNGYSPEDEGWGRGGRPVIHVSWNDAQRYVAWLSRSTGATYRLPSEAEWEYAARAGTTTAFSWGNRIRPRRANCNDDQCEDGYPNTAPVGRFPANAWGLYDMHGNVYEWLQDCRNGTRYFGGPTDGGAWEETGCDVRRHRGGSWRSPAASLRVARRSTNAPERREDWLGFRVARTLPAPGPSVVPVFPAASDTGPQGFVRVINHSAEAGEVRVDVFDEAGETFGPLTLTLGANETKHFNSHDLERGNADKGLQGSAGSGAEAWRLELSSPLNIEVLSYLRTPDGFLTAMQDVAPGIDRRHRVAIFNPGSNRGQRSILRLVNPGMATAQVTIEGVDDRGRSPGGPVRVSVPAGAARSYSAWELESGGSGLRGALGDGSGKWRLHVEADQPILAMSLLESPTGHLTNLSAAPQRGLAPDIFNERISGDIVQSKCVACHVDGGDAGDTRLVFVPSDTPDHRALNREVFRRFLAELANGPDVILGETRGLGHGGGVQLEEDSEEYADLERFLALLDEESQRFPAVADTGIDYDGDGITNALDPDDDGDGVSDQQDAFPGNPLEWADTNGNGRGDNGEFLGSGRDPPSVPDPVQIEGRVILDGALMGARVDLTAPNGSAVAQTRTDRNGWFSFTLSEALLPDWFVLRASGGVVHRVSEDGQTDEEVPNLGTLRAYVGKSDYLAMVLVSPWTELVFQEVRLRYPAQEGLPSGLDADEILDEIAATLPDGSYDAVLSHGGASATDEVMAALDRAIVAPILAGATSSEMANRVELFRTQFEDEGVTGDNRELRRVQDDSGTRVLTVFRSNEANGLAEVRQAFVDESGTLVDARVSRVNERDSTLRLDINHAGSRSVGLSGTTTVLQGTDYSRNSLERLGDAFIDLSPTADDNGVMIDIDKGLAQAISKGRLLFEIDGGRPAADELAIVRDDPLVRWDFDADIAALNDEGVHVFGDVPARVLANDDFLVLQFFREADRDIYSGFDGRAARRGFYLWLAEEVVVGGLAHLSGQFWIKALSEAYSAYGVVEHAGTRYDYLEGLTGSTRVNVNKRGSQADDLIQPGQEYGLDFFFDHAVWWTRRDARGRPELVQCPEYTRSDIERARRNKTFRKRLTGAVEDMPCHADVTLKLQQKDAFEYRADSPVAAPNRSHFQLLKACTDADYDSYQFNDADGEYYCHRVDEDRSSKAVGTLTGLEHGYYWAIPRQAVRFGARAELASAGEVVVGARMTLELADDRDLYSRDLHYEVALRGRELHPAFYGASDGRSLILDARASVVGPLVPADSVEFVWSYIAMEPGGDVIEQGGRQFRLLEPTVKWQHTAPKPIFEVPLADLGLVGDEDVEIQIRLEMTARGLASESITKVVPIEAQAWNQTIFEVIQQEAEEANRIDLKPEFRSRVGNLTLVVGTAMRTLQLPEASGGDRPLRYSVATRLPPGLSYYSDSRQIRGTPSQEGSWDIRYRATDQDGDTAELRFTIRVTPREPPDRRPVLPHIGDRTYDVGDRVSWQLPQASSGDGRKTYDLHGTLPPGLGFNRSDRRLSGTTTTAGRYPLRYEVRDEDGDRDSVSFTITVREDTNRPPPPPSGGWITGRWDVTDTEQGCETVGGDLDVSYRGGVYALHVRGRGLVAEIHADGSVTCTYMQVDERLEFRGYPSPADFGRQDFLRMFFCGDHIPVQERPSCSEFTFRTFSEDRIVVEEMIYGNPGTTTFVRGSGN